MSETHAAAQELRYELPTRLDTNNAEEVLESLKATGAFGHEGTVVLDAAHTAYVSSAGLRVILRLMKSTHVRIDDVLSEVYDVFEMTGFTEMVEVRKALRSVSVEGCEVIGTGANGTVYRIDPETIVKVYAKPDALPEIKRERELARRAFVMGVPTAIPYDVVRVGDLYGSVFELLNAKSFDQLLVEGEMSVDDVAQESAEILHQMHDNVVTDGLLPDCREELLDKLPRLEGSIGPDALDRLRSLLEAMPACKHMLHGDFHVKNVMVQAGESLLIDMDTLCVGDPIFEFAGMYRPYVSFPEADPGNLEIFFGLPDAVGRQIWEKTLRRYFADQDDAFLAQVTERARLLADVHMLTSFCPKAATSERAQRFVEYYAPDLEELLPRVDALALPHV